MSLKPLFKSILMLSFVSLAACNQYSESGLFGDFQSTAKCPANGCANQEPSANELRMTYGGSAVSLFPAATDTKIEINGDCHASTYPSNKINVTVVTQTGNQPVAAGAYSVTGSSTQPACRQGKFGFALDLRSMPSGAIYTVKMELVAYTAAGAAVTNPGGGVLQLSLVR